MAGRVAATTCGNLRGMGVEAVVDERGDRDDGDGAVVWTGRFTARYPGDCGARCGFTIECGDEIRARPGEVRHTECVPEWA